MYTGTLIVTTVRTILGDMVIAVREPHRSTHKSGNPPYRATPWAKYLRNQYGLPVTDSGVLYGSKTTNKSRCKRKIRTEQISLRCKAIYKIADSGIVSLLDVAFIEEAVKGDGITSTMFTPGLHGKGVAHPDLWEYYVMEDTTVDELYTAAKLNADNLEWFASPESITVCSTIRVHRWYVDQATYIKAGGEVENI